MTEPTRLRAELLEAELRTVSRILRSHAISLMHLAALAQDLDQRGIVAGLCPEVLELDDARQSVARALGLLHAQLEDDCDDRDDALRARGA